MGEHSQKLFQEAQMLMPGGVNSPVRACRSVGLDPLFIRRGLGSRVWDADDKEYIDYVCSWGTAISGHSNPTILGAVKEALENGLSFGAPTEAENAIAKKLTAAVPSLEKVRFVSSGTEACMSAIRLARGYTEKSVIIKFDGHYHGHSDSLLAQAGSGLATLNIPCSAGVPEEVIAKTISIPFNSKEALDEVFQKNKGSIAAVILEPIMGNSGFIKGKPGYLKYVQEICQKHQALMILDEVMTGFRVAWGGAQVLEEVTPDLSIFGKVVGGGLPLAVYGGKAEIMDHIAPLGPVYQAGTLSGNPIAVAAGRAALQTIDQPSTYSELHKKSGNLIQGIQSLAYSKGIPVSSDHQGGMFGIFFCEGPVEGFADAQRTDQKLFKTFFSLMRESGIYWPPSPFEACFISTEHSDNDIALTLEAVEHAFSRMRSGQT